MTFNFRLLAAASIVAMTPAASQALTFVTDTSFHTVSSSTNQFIGVVSTTPGSGGSFSVTFTAGFLPLPFTLDAELALTALEASTFKDLEMSWLDASSGAPISTLPVVGGMLNSLGTDLNAPISQALLISWTNSLAGIGFTIVANPTPGSIVPLPMSALLLGTALAGFGVAFHRRKQA